MRAIRQHIYTPPLHSGLLPPNCVALTAHKEQWTVTLASDCDCYDVFYHNTAYENFPVPRLLLSCTINSGRLQNFRLAVADQGELTPETALFKCPFPNVNGFSLCVGSNMSPATTRPANYGRSCTVSWPFRSVMITTDRSRHG